MSASKHKPDHATRRLKTEDAGQYLGGIAPTTMRIWRCKGTGPAYIKIGNRVVYDTADLDAFMAARKVGGQA